MGDWINDLVSGFGNSIASAVSTLWENISTGIFDVFFQWLYKILFTAIAEFFTFMGNMGTELFDLPWVKAILSLFQYFGWALFAAGLIVAVFDTAIEYQSMGRFNIKRQILPFLYGFLAVNLFTVVPVRLYCWCITIQNTLMHDLSSLFASEQGVGTNIGAIAGNALASLAPVSMSSGTAAATMNLLNLFLIIALGYCVIKVFFANIKRGGMLLTNIAIGSLYMFSIPKGNTEGFISWCRQVIAICITAFLQMTLLFIGLMTFKTNMLLGLGVMLAANEVPQIAKQRAPLLGEYLCNQKHIYARSLLCCSKFVDPCKEKKLAFTNLLLTNEDTDGIID